MLGPTTPPLPASAAPEGETACTRGNADSSWDRFSCGDLSRNALSLKRKAAMFRISLQHFQHIWLRTAGEAAFSTHIFTLVLEVCQLLVGLRGAGEESSNL